MNAICEGELQFRGAMCNQKVSFQDLPKANKTLNEISMLRITMIALAAIGLTVFTAASPGISSVVSIICGIGALGIVALAIAIIGMRYICAAFENIHLASEAFVKGNYKAGYESLQKYINEHSILSQSSPKRVTIFGIEKGEFLKSYLLPTAELYILREEVSKGAVEGIDKRLDEIQSKSTTWTKDQLTLIGQIRDRKLGSWSSTQTVNEGALLLYTAIHDIPDSSKTIDSYNKIIVEKFTKESVGEKAFEKVGKVEKAQELVAALKSFTPAEVEEFRVRITA